MQERDQTSRGAAARARVEQAQPKSGETIETALYVIDRIRDVVQTTAALCEELCDLRVGTRAAEQLDARVAHLEHHCLDAVALDEISVRRGRIRELCIRRDRGVEIRDGDADMVNTVERSHPRPSIGRRCLTRLQRYGPANTRASSAQYDRHVALRRLLLGGLLVFTIGFAVFALEHMFPPQPYGIADDWRVFYAAATVVQHGGNPYDATTIHAAEQAAQHYQNVQPSLDDFTDLPIVTLVLRAVTWLPYWASYAAFTAAGIVIVVSSLFGWMRSWGWRLPALWLLGGVASWPVLLGLFSGQFDAVLLGATIAALLLMRRRRPVAAGLCMAAVLLKPHLLWPLPLLLFAVWLDDPRQSWRFAASAAGVVVSGTLIGFLLVPNSSGFLGHLLGFGSRVADVQPDLAGIPGMLLYMPGSRAVAVAVAAIGVVAVLALAVGIAGRGRRQEIGEHARALIPLAGLAVWLALTPYAHPNDDVLLFPLLVLVLGRDAGALEGRALAAGMVAAAVVAAAFIAAPALGLIVIAGGAGWLMAQRRRVTAPLAAALAFPALALLPTVWPFHVLSVPVTPVAVALTALAGMLGVREMLGTPQSGSESERSGRVGRVVVEAAPALAAETPGRH